MKNNISVLQKYEEFRRVFGIFKGAPFYEAWKEEEFLEEFEYLKTYGEIFGFYTNTGDVAGLVSLIYGAKDSHPVKFLEPKKVMYLSDIAVLPKYRGNGYAKELAKFAISYTKWLEFYKEMYLRTNLEGSMSERIFMNYGFDVMKKDGIIITEEVSFERTNPEISNTDVRKFLSKRLR